jgi:LysM repeat protein
MEKDMTDKDKESAQDVIEAYRKRQKKAQKAPILLGVAAGLLVVGAAALIFWLVGPGLPQMSFLATDTPTPTQTFTPTSTSTATLIPTETPTSTATPTVTLTPTLPGPFVYEVLENDSLFTIAEKFKVDLLVLIAINNLDATNPIIRVGDKLTIPGPDTQLPTSSPIPLSMRRGTLVEYTVQTGDTLAIIADKFNSTVDDIVKENELTDPNAIFVGQKLNIPVNLVTPVPSSTPGPSLTPSATVTATP